MKQLKFVWLLVVLLALAACGRDVAPDTLKATDTAAPTITSDKEDYAPGELVTLTGSNWQPGENVQIVVDDDGIYEYRWKRDVNVTADGDGNITDKFNLPDWFVADYVVNATGETSGKATASFTDSNIRGKVQGGPTQATIQVRTYSAGNTTCASPQPSSTDAVISDSGFATLAAAGSNQSVQLTAPATIGSFTFSKWSTGATTRTICQVGSNGNVNLTVEYVAAVAVNTTTSLESSLSPSTSGQSVTFTATVAAASGDNPPAGTVTFKNGTTNLGTATLVRVGTTKTATATYSTDALVVGSHSITAVYAGATGFNTSTSSVLTQQVNAACTAPSITTQPVGATKTVGESVTFSVTAGGTAPLSYQWRKGGNDINGATSASYTVSSVATSDAGEYTVRVSGQCGSPVTSNTATLTVNKDSATLSLSNLNPTYDGSAKAATVTTVPAGLSGVTISYSQNGNAVNRPTNAGSYTVVATLDNPSYSAQDATGTLVIAKANQAIDFGALENKTFGDPSFTISATGGASGNPVTFAVQGNCTIAGTTVSIDGAGSCTITASQASNDNYNAAANVQQSFTIDKADQTITWEAPARITYGTPLSSAQLNASTNGGGDLTYSPAAGAVLDAGTRELTVSAAETANYKATSATVELEVTKASLTVTASDQSVAYGTDPDDFTVSYVGFVNGETQSALSGDLSFTGAGTNAGTYTITPAGLTSSNYDITFVAGRLTITKAQATITLGNLSHTYDGTAKSASASTSPADLSGLSVTYDGAAKVPSKAGTYAVVASLTNDNYEATAANGTLEIAKAPTTTTVSCAAGPFTYNGSAQSPCSASVTGAGGLNESLPVTYSNNTNAGTATASASYAGGDNHNGSTGSTTFTIAQLSQTINFTSTAPTNVFWGDSYTPSATGGGSGNQVTFGASGACSISSGVVTMNRTGTCTVSANQQGNVNYSAAPQVSQSFSVSAWTVEGFFSPVDYSGTFNTVKNGSTVPLKFRVFKGTQQLTDTRVVSGLKPSVTSCSTSATIDNIEELTTGGTSLRYDTSAAQFIFNWQTPRKAGSCYNVTVQMVDGTSIPVAKFMLK